MHPSAVAVAVLALAFPVGESGQPPGVTAETCRGIAATLVGTPGADLTGTPGPDVVVTNGAATVDTGDGDDLVCTTGTMRTADRSGVLVFSGSGNDTVDTTADGPRVSTGTRLGDGDDTFDGGRARDSVDARDEGHDTVTTGGGNDSISTGSSTGVDEDLVDAGASGDVLHADGRLGPGARVAGGAGRDYLSVIIQNVGRWVFDNRKEEVRHDGARAWRFAGIERFQLGQIEPVGRIAFVGGPGDELLIAGTSAFAGASLGGGNDTLYLGSPRLRGGRAVRAGAGRDRLWLMPPGPGSVVDRAELDLGVGSLSYVDQQGRRSSLIVNGFESADLHARSVRATGSPHSDVMTAGACEVRMTGGDGKDWLGVIPDEQCAAGTRRALYGGPGDDRLSGSGYDDLLVGGPGDDQADGFDGRDRCDAEIVRRCELSAP
jgi:hypothetical protein